jgi:preprotein translocase subunit SecG
MPMQLKWAVAFAFGLALIALGWQVPVLLKTMHILICLVLVVVVLLQSGKAADLAGAFGGAGSQTAFGPRGAATFLSKATTWCAVMFMLLSLALFLSEAQRSSASGSGLFQDAPASAPAQQQTPPATPPATPPTPQP